MEKVNEFKVMNEEKKEQGLSIHEIGGKTVITAPTGAVYLSEFMKTLPAGILNKKETGCGATTVVLENQENVIIACPTRQLIINKVTQYPNKRCPYKLFAVQKGVRQNQIEEYVEECNEKQPVKIMVTYDSFPRVFALMKQKGIECKIVVDEYQEILDAYIYRNDAIRNLLNELKGVPNVTYLSATPIPYKWRPSELEGLPEYEIEWENTVRIMPLRIQSDQPLAMAANIIRNHKMGRPFELRGSKVEEYFFFVNSVSAISNIIKSAKLSPDEVKIICAKNEHNKRKLGNFTIGDANGRNKSFTFCTKTVFYGADFYSKAGLTVIVSEGHAKSSLLDISTDIIQIAGRIRTKENPFKNVILHIYNTGIMCDSKTEYKERLNERLITAQKTIKAYESLNDDLRCVITKKIRIDDPEELTYYNTEEKKVEIDKMKIAHAEYKFETIDDVYTNGISLREAYLKAGCNIEDTNSWEQNIRDNLYFGMRKSRFEILYKVYSEERKKHSDMKSDFAKNIEMQNDIIPLAYNVLGDEEVEKLNYNETKISKRIHFKHPETQDALKEELKTTFKEGNRYSFKEIKYQLNLCYQKLRIDITANAIQLCQYFSVKRVKIPTNNKRVDGYEIKGIAFFAMQ
jgi:hypothetical protein